MSSIEKILNNLHALCDAKKAQSNIRFDEHLDWLRSEFSQIRILIDAENILNIAPPEAGSTEIETAAPAVHSIVPQPVQPNVNAEVDAQFLRQKRKSPEVGQNISRNSPLMKRTVPSVEDLAVAAGLPRDLNKLTKEQLLNELEKRGCVTMTMKALKKDLVDQLRVLLERSYTPEIIPVYQTSANLQQSTADVAIANLASPKSIRKGSLLAEYRSQISNTSSISATSVVAVTDYPPADVPTIVQSVSDAKTAAEFEARQRRHRSSQANLATLQNVPTNVAAEALVNSIDEKISVTESEAPNVSSGERDSEQETSMDIVSPVKEPEPGTVSSSILTSAKKLGFIPSVQLPVLLQGAFEDCSVVPVPTIVNILEDNSNNPDVPTNSSLPVPDIVSTSSDEQILSSSNDAVSAAGVEVCEERVDSKMDSNVFNQHETASAVSEEDNGADSNEYEPSFQEDIGEEDGERELSLEDVIASVESEYANIDKSVKLSPVPEISVTPVVSSAPASSPGVYNPLHAEVEPIKENNTENSSAYSATQDETSTIDSSKAIAVPTKKPSNLVSGTGQTSFFTNNTSLQSTVAASVKPKAVVPALQQAARLKEKEEARLLAKKKEQEEKKRVALASGTASGPFSSSTGTTSVPNAAPKSILGSFFGKNDQKPSSTVASSNQSKVSTTNASGALPPTVKKGLFGWGGSLAKKEQSVNVSAAIPNNPSSSVTTVVAATSVISESIVAEPPPAEVIVVSAASSVVVDAENISPISNKSVTAIATSVATASVSVPSHVLQEIPVTNVSEVEENAEQEYIIEDREDSDSDNSGTDDEGNEKLNKPKPHIPEWAKGPQLKAALEKQYGFNGHAFIDPDTIFHEVHSCSLEEIFGRKEGKAGKYSTRTSSAKWDVDKLSLTDKRKYRVQMGYENTV